MAPLDPAVLSESIARFLQLSQERALDKTTSSLQAAITLLQERYNQGMKASQVITANQQEETKAIRVAITNLQDRSYKHDERDEEFGLLRETVKSLQTLAKKAEADNTKLQQAVAELRAQLSHAEDTIMKAEASRIQYQKNGSFHSREPRQTVPPQRQPQPNQFFEDTNEERVLSQIVAHAHLQSPTPIVQGHDRAQQQDRPLGQPYPRGVKRAHVGDAAEPPRKTTPAREAKNTRTSWQPRRFTVSTDRRDHNLSHDDKVPRREEKNHSNVEDRVAARQKEFVDYVKSMCDQYKADNYGRSQRAFICRFIDGIKDPVLFRWFQESLKARYPDKVLDVKQSARKAGGRIIAPTRDLTWKDIEFLLPRTPWPSMTD